MILCNGYKFLYIKNQKVGGSSMEIALSSLLSKGDYVTYLNPEEELLRGDKTDLVLASALRVHGKKILDDPDIVDENGKLLGERYSYPHRGIWFAENKLGLSKNLDEYYSFCVERNPWDKIISGFFFSGRHWQIQQKSENEIKKRFTTFCNRRKNLYYLSDFNRYSKDGKIAVNCVLRYENLSEGFSEVMKEIGAPHIKIGARAKSSFRIKELGPDFFYGPKLGNEASRAIAEVFSQEIKHFGYKPDQLQS